MSKFKQSQVKRVLAILLIVGISIILFISARRFLGSFLSSIILFTLFRPVHKKFVEKYNIGSSLSSVLVMLISLFAIIIPLVVTMLVIGNGLLTYINDNINSLNDLSPELPARIADFDITIFGDYTLRQALETVQINYSQIASTVAETLQKLISNATTSTANFFLQTVIMYFILFYLFKDMKRLTKVLYEYSPFNRKNTDIVMKDFQNMTLANVVGSGITAIAQGLALSIGFLIFGIEEPVFWGFVAGVMSFIPVIGPVLIWLPTGLLLLLNGDITGGVGILIWGVLVISLVDNATRILTNKRIGNIHPLVSIIGVFIGLPLFGILGIVLGPVILSFFVLFIRLFKEEYVDSKS